MIKANELSIGNTIIIELLDGTRKEGVFINSNLLKAIDHGEMIAFGI